MKTLQEYISGPVCESGNISDNQIKYIIGVNWLNGMNEKPRRDRMIEKYHINRNNYREAIIKMFNDRMVPLVKEKDEIIPRSKWDLESLVGETENQLINRAYYDAANIVLRTKPKHDILTLFQCSSIKPYYANRAYDSMYMCWAKEWSDAASISNPGIIPWEFCDRYPYRYDEWSIPKEETLKEIIDMTHKYRIVNMCRFVRFMRAKKYRHVLVFIPNKMKAWIFEQIRDHNIDGLGDKITIVISDHLRGALKKKYATSLGRLLTSRLATMGAPKRAYISALRKYCKPDDPDHFKEVTDRELSKINQSLSESLDVAEVLEQLFDEWCPGPRPVPVLESDSPSYEVREYTASKVVSDFKNHPVIKDNLDSDGTVDKGPNGLYYRSYYWTALDIVLYILDGNLTEDIDGLYWSVRKVLDSDPDFGRFGDFLYYYKPLMKNDDLSEKDFEAEALKIRLISDTKVRHKPNFLGL